MANKDETGASMVDAGAQAPRIGAAEPGGRPTGRPADAAAARRAVEARIVAATTRWSAGATLAEIRSDFETLLAGPEPARVETIDLDGLPATLTVPAGAPTDAVIYWCHGGGFQIGSPRSHRSLVCRIAAAAGVRVVTPDYRLAPEHRHPAAIDDCVHGHRALVAAGCHPRRIVPAGDSAGGALALEVAMRARDAGLEPAAGLVLISPWLDLALRGESYETRAALDVFSKPAQLRAMARTYLGRDRDPADPAVSAFDGVLSGLPPILVHVGDHDITRDDGVRLAAQARAVGVAVELAVWPEMYHHFQVFVELPEAARSIAAIGTFVRARLGL